MEQKRKTAIGNEENIPENTSGEQSPPKRARKEDEDQLLHTLSKLPPSSHYKLRSNLPRFQAKGARKSLVKGDKVAPQNLTTPSTTQSTPRKLLNILSGFALNGNKQSCPSTSASGHFQAHHDDLKEEMPMIPIPHELNIIKIFDTSISISEDRVSAIIASLKVKSKWDFKEKAKRQDTAIRDLKDTLLTVLAEVRLLKEKCVNHEAQLLTKNRTVESALQKALAHTGVLQISEEDLRSEVQRLSSELRNVSNLANSFKRDNSPLRSKSKELEIMHRDLLAKFASEEALRKRAESELLKLEKEVIETKRDCSSTLELFRMQAEQRLEQLIESNKMELANLKAELGRRQSDAQRTLDEKAEVDRRHAEVREEMFGLRSRLREFESTAQRYEKDVDRLSSEVDSLKNKLQLREVELQGTISAHQENLRQISDEKTNLRIELSATQSRLLVAESDRMSLIEQLADKRESLSTATIEISRLQDTVKSLDAKMKQGELEANSGKEAMMQLEVERELRARCEVREEAERRERIAACAQLMAIQNECATKLRESEEKCTVSVTMLERDVLEARNMQNMLTERAKASSDTIARLQSEVAQLKESLQSASSNHESLGKLGELMGEIEVLRRRLDDANEMKLQGDSASSDRIRALEDQVRAGEVQRRKLHNLVQELRGNVRVFARVRPFLPTDGVDLAAPFSSISVRSDGVGLRISRPGGDENNFVFDRVFGPSSSQETVFLEVSEFVQSALDGYNVCLFSYGQTGSGKTHTMQGCGSSSQRGIIPRAVHQVGLYKSQLEAKGWEYHMEVSFVEIYNETIRDLLRNSPHEDLKHDIKRDVNGNTFITDITMMAVDPNDTDQMDGIMELAARHRSVERTSMNERSSRSHSIFTLHLRATNLREGIVLKGTLNLVDLAGSERLDRSLATGARLKETVAINKSLSSLVDVFVAIGNKQSHIPFRNSKLTYLLQPALSGDGKTLMMINLSPTEDSFHESLCTLRFASQVSQCELGKPKRQLKDVSSESLQECSSAKSSLLTKSTPSSTVNNGRKQPKEGLKSSQG